MERLEKLQNIDQVVRYRLVLVMTRPNSDAKDRLDELVGVWVRQDTVQLSRLALEAIDNTPDQFLSDFQAALRIPSNEPLNSAATSLEDGLIDLLNSILETDRDFILVLENYHVIHNFKIHAALGLLLDYLPPRMHLILASRELPPLPIPRLRVRAQMKEFGI